MSSFEHKIYFPAVIHSVHASPIDALTSLCVPNDEASSIVIASWYRSTQCLFAVVNGGRTVVAIKTGEVEWAACNTYLDYASPSFEEAKRQLERILKRGQNGMVGELELLEKPGQR